MSAYPSSLFGDPLETVSRRRRSPNEFGADLGDAPAARGGPADAVYAGLKADRPNRREDLSRLGHALGEAGEAEDAASLETPERAAQAIGTFQRRRGLKVDGWAHPF